MLCLPKEVSGGWGVRTLVSPPPAAGSVTPTEQPVPPVSPPLAHFPSQSIAFRACVGAEQALLPCPQEWDVHRRASGSSPVKWG